MSMKSVAHFKIFFSTFFFKSWKSFQGLGGSMLTYAACPPEGIQHPLTSKWWWPGREDAVLLLPYLRVVQHAGAHGLCVLVLLNYALFPEKSSVVCRSFSADMDSTSTPGCRSHVLTHVSLTSVFYPKTRLSHSPLLPTTLTAFWLSSVPQLQACLLLVTSLLKLCTFLFTNSCLFWSQFLKIVFIFRVVEGSGDVLVQG